MLMARNEATDKSYKACLVQAEAKPRRSESWQTYSTTRCCANKYQVQLCYEMHTRYWYWKHQRYAWRNEESNGSNSASSPKLVSLSLVEINRWRDWWNAMLSCLASGNAPESIWAFALFGIFFSLLQNSFWHSQDVVFLHTRSDGKLFNLAILPAKTKVRASQSSRSMSWCLLMTLE